MTTATKAAKGRLWSFDRNSVIFLQGGDVEAPFIIEDGIIRLCMYFADGHRAVAGFAFPGDIIGLDCGRHMLTAETATTALLREWPDAMEVLKSPQCRALVHAVEQANTSFAIRSRREPSARVAAFLHALGERGLGTTFHAQLPRIDVAEHLGLSVFTVSRIMTLFRDRGLIRRLPGGRLIVLDPDRLRAIANDDPGFPADPLPLTNVG